MDYSRLAVLAAAFLLPHAATADELCREISLGYTSGDIGGYPQGPANLAVIGFSPVNHGSDFNTLGFDDFHQWNFEGGYHYGRNRFYLGYDRTRLNNEFDIEPPTEEELAGVSSPGGFTVVRTPLDVSTQLDYYRLGYQRLFELEWLGRRLTLAPGVEMNVLDFDYRLNMETTLVPVEDSVYAFDPDAPFSSIDDASGVLGDADFSIAEPIAVIRPDYTKWGLRIGGEAEFHLSERLSLTAELYDTAGIDDWPDVFTGKLGFRFRLYEGNNTAIDLFGRGGAETIKLNRDETRWNDLRAEYRDLIEGGIRVRF